MRGSGHALVSVRQNQCRGVAALVSPQLRIVTRYSVGSDLRATRARLEISQRELARRLGVAHNTVAGWERGETEPPPNLSDLIEEVAATVQMERATMSESQRRKDELRRRRIRTYNALHDARGTMQTLSVIVPMYSFRDERRLSVKEDSNAQDVSTWLPAQSMLPGNHRPHRRSLSRTHIQSIWTRLLRYGLSARPT